MGITDKMLPNCSKKQQTWFLRKNSDNRVETKNVMGQTSREPLNNPITNLISFTSLVNECPSLMKDLCLCSDFVVVVKLSGWKHVFWQFFIIHWKFPGIFWSTFFGLFFGKSICLNHWANIGTLWKKFINESRNFLKSFIWKTVRRPGYFENMRRYVKWQNFLLNSVIF